MGRRELEIVQISAESLTIQNPWYLMVVSAGAYISNSSVPVQYTSRDFNGGVNPTWTEPLRFTLEYRSGTSPEEFLCIELYNTAPDGRILCFGIVQVPVNDFIQFAGEQATLLDTRQYPVSTGGILKLSYRLGAYISTVGQWGRTLTGITTSVVGSVIGHGINSLLDSFNN